MHNKFVASSVYQMRNMLSVASSVYQKNVVDHREGTKELKELELCEELSEEEMMRVVGGVGYVRRPLDEVLWAKIKSKKGPSL